MKHRGFTLIELMVIIVVIGVLVIGASSRLNTGGLAVRGYQDALAAAARDAQRYARNSGCPTSFVIAANNYSVRTTVPCGGGAQTVQGLNGNLAGTAPTGVTASATNVTFDAYGGTAGGATVTVTDGSSTRSFVIQAGSGYVNTS